MNNQELEQLVYRLVLKAIKELEENKADEIPVYEITDDEITGGEIPAYESTANESRDSGRACESIELIKQVLTESDVRQAMMSRVNEICIPQKTIITCLAAEYATKHGVVITRRSNFSGTK